MIDPVAIQLLQAGKSKGLHEAFSFQGRSADGVHAFWLRHELLRRRGSRDIQVDNVLVTFDRRTGVTQCIHEQETITPAAFKQAARSGQWSTFSFNFASGSFFEISPEGLRGRMHTRKGSAAWELALTPGAGLYRPFASERLYRLHRLPCILLPASALELQGRVSCAGMVLNGPFRGNSQHQWSGGRPEEFAWSLCNRFHHDEEAFFSGLSLRYTLAAGLLKTPYMSLASLQVGGKWHHFNSLLGSTGQVVTALDNYRWLASFENRSHRLEVTIDGANPRIEPWVALHEQAADGTHVLVKNTKFAAGKLRLYEKHDQEPVHELGSEFFELETRWGEGVQESGVRVGVP
jgi:hypothetical protein